ncbi:hypothetical protein [Kibdelosporangium philippinense]|uniref:hypothetical protein n=1 Tax=Kibdelosporangium philippinense TaxID=211113 RepID=UPI00361A41F1
MLPPGEAALMRDANTQATNELKRLGIYKQDADPNKISGLKATGLKFDEARSRRSTSTSRSTCWSRGSWRSTPTCATFR